MEAERFPGDDLAGQIFIEPITAKKQAAEKNVIWKDEMEYLFVHALLHLFGYDHENETDFRNMFGLQGKIMPGQKWATFEDQILRESFGGRGASAGNHEQ
jgi:rRNA maturation RNase YbeY